MSEQVTLTAVTELATQLPPAEQKQLAESILQRLNSGVDAPRSSRRAWREIRGSVPFPLCGEDAQTWVTHGRRESEEQRERQRSSNQ